MPSTTAVRIGQVSPATWLERATAARQKLSHADALSPLPAEQELIGARCHLSDDGRSGYVIADGDLRQVFSSVRGRGDALVSSAIENGARTLNCFDGYLPALYARHGFREYRREQNWTAGGPDVVYMARPDTCATFDTDCHCRNIRHACRRQA